MVLTDKQLKEEGLSNKAIAKLQKTNSRVSKNSDGEYAIKGYIDIICKDIATLEKLLKY